MKLYELEDKIRGIRDRCRFLNCKEEGFPLCEDGSMIPLYILEQILEFFKEKRMLYSSPNIDVFIKKIKT